MRTSAAFAPGHVTGFFSIQDQDEDLLKKGSTGAGFCLSRGVRTTLTESKATWIKIGDDICEAPVSRKVLEVFSRRAGKSLPPLNIHHEIDIPLGSGFGSSGAGALSLALALNQFFDHPLSWEQAAACAHEAEVFCHTGLGTVMGEAYGRFEIRLKPGAPGVGQVVLFPVPQAWEAVFCLYGPLSTQGLLQDPGVRDRINSSGAALTSELLKNPCLSEFTQLSRDFAQGTGLITPRLAQVLKWSDSQGIPGSMLMFGEGLFFLLPPSQAPAFGEDLSARAPGARIFHSALDTQGAR